MSRVEHIGNATLYLGDCREILPTLGDVAAVITDPPYGVRERTMRKAAGRSNLAECNDFPPVFGDDEPFDPSPWLKFSKVVLFGGNHFCSRLPDSSSWLIWDKRDGVPSNDNADCEIAWSNIGGPARLIRHLWSGMIKASEKDERRVHPTQKPVAVMAWAIDQCKLQPNALVLDPYMGSGTTGVAAIKAGLRFVGIEVSPSISRSRASALMPLLAKAICSSRVPLDLPRLPQHLRRCCPVVCGNGGGGDGDTGTD